MSKSAFAKMMVVNAEKENAARMHAAQRPLEVPVGSDPLVGYMRKVFADTSCFRGSLASAEKKSNRSQEESD